MQEVGRVTHYYNKIGVAIVELSGALKVGDSVRIERGAAARELVVGSMQVEHKPVTEAKKGEVVGIETNGEVHEGAKVFKVS